MGTTTVCDDRNSESPANDDDWTGKERLDDLMGLEPSIGRGSEVARDQSTQGQEKQKSDKTKNPVSDDHSVSPCQGD